MHDIHTFMSLQKQNSSLIFFTTPMIFITTEIIKTFYSLKLTTYNKTCLKRPLKNRQNESLKHKINGSLMKVESIAECSVGAFCNTLDLH